MKILQQTLLLFAVAALVYALYKRLLVILSPGLKTRPYPQLSDEPRIENGKLNVTFKTPPSYVIQGKIHKEDGSLLEDMQVITIGENEIQLTADISATGDHPFYMEISGKDFRFVRNFK